MNNDSVTYWFENYYKKASFSKLVNELSQIHSELKSEGYTTHRRCRNQTLAVLKALKTRCFYAKYEKDLDW